MLPILDKLATNMKGVGVYVGKVNIDKYQEFSRMFNIRAVPKMFLFVPHKAPIEYASERSPKAIGQFILSHQPGTAQITVLNTEDRLANFFNATRTAPRILLFSKKTTIPPLFKHLCYQHRKGIRCGFSSQSSSTLNNVFENLKSIGEFDSEAVTYPSVWAYNRTATPPITKYQGQLELSALNDFFNSFDKVNQTVERSTTPKKENKEKKTESAENPTEEKQPKEVVTPPRPHRPVFSFHTIDEQNYKDTCLANKKLCLVFFFDQSLPEAENTEVASSIETSLQEHYAELGYTFLKTNSTSLSSLPHLRKLLTSQPTLQEGKPGVLVINKHKGKTASWIPTAEPGDKGVAVWKMFGNFMDRLTGGEIKFTKASFEEQETSGKSDL